MVPRTEEITAAPTASRTVPMIIFLSSSVVKSVT